MVSRRVDAPQEVGEHVGAAAHSCFRQAASTRRPSHLRRRKKRTPVLATPGYGRVPLSPARRDRGESGYPSTCLAARPRADGCVSETDTRRPLLSGIRLEPSRVAWQRPGVRLSARPLRLAGTRRRAPQCLRPVGSEAHTNRFSGRAAWVPTPSARRSALSAASAARARGSTSRGSLCSHGKCQIGKKGEARSARSSPCSRVELRFHVATPERYQALFFWPCRHDLRGTDKTTRRRIP